MDESLAAKLSASVRISLDADDINLIHPRYDMYKAKNIPNQEERRQEWLRNLKEKRLETYNIQRGIQNVSNVEEMELQITARTKFKKYFPKIDRPYKDWLMLSEWLVDIPDNLASDWYFIVCPEGKRVLIVADKGSTCAYSRKGECLLKFPSALPGGNSERPRGYTVVDCIWHHQTKTFYLLDVLAWGVPFVNCEADLRYFWLKNKYMEYPELMNRSTANRHRFLLLQRNITSQLQEVISLHPIFENNFPKVDGVIFFHKDAVYSAGKSPLVTWLKPFMIPDILQVRVADQYILEKPENYPDKPVENMVVEKSNKSRYKKNKNYNLEKSENSPDKPVENMDVEKSKKPSNTKTTS